MDQSKTDWRLVFLLWAAGLGAAAQYGKLAVVFDQLPNVYPNAGAGLGFVVSLVGFLGIVLGVIAGVLVDRFGYRRAILWSLVLGAVMSLAQASFPPLPIFLTTRLLEGAAHLAIVVAAPTLIAQITLPQHRGFALTLWGSFFGVAFAILAFFGLPFAARWGLSALMVAHAVYMFLIAAILWPLLSKIKVSRPKATTPTASPNLLKLHLGIYRSPYIGASALGWLFYTMCFVAILTVFPPFVAAEIRGFVVGAMPLMSILSSLTLGVLLLGYLPATTVVMLGFTSCSICAFGLMFASGSPAWALALGASFGLVQGASFAAVPQLNAAMESRALANGGLAQMGNLGNTIGTPLMVLCLASVGYRGMMAAVGLVLLTGALVHLLLFLLRQRQLAANP